MGWACSAYEGEERCINGFGGKPEVKRKLGRPRHRWEDIKMDLQEVGLGGMDWIELAQDKDKWRALLYGVKNIRGSITCGESVEWLKTG